MEMEHRDFVLAGLEYVCLIQEVQERKKFEFVEIVSCIFFGGGGGGRQFCDLTKFVHFIQMLPMCNRCLNRDNFSWITYAAKVDLCLVQLGPNFANFEFGNSTEQLQFIHHRR